MSNPSTLTLQLIASVANGICQSQTPGGAGNLTINGSLATGGVATMDVARRVLIASTGADAGKTFTITGTSRDGNVQSETITGVLSGTSQYSVLDYLTVTRVAVSAGTAGAITVGTNGVASSVWIVDNYLARSWAFAGGIAGPVGTVYTLEHTYDDPNASAPTLTASPQQWSSNPASNVPPMPWPHLNVNNVSGRNNFDYPDHPIFAHRLTIISGTGLVVMQSIQAGID